MAVTLLQKGKIIPPLSADEQERVRISNTTAIDYIMEWFDARTPTQIGGTAHINPTSIKDRVLIIKAGTGSGKSTSIGPELYARYAGRGLGAGRSIAVTQPRVLTTIGLPNKITKIPTMSFLKYGENLGYQTGPFVNKPPKGLVFMTVGVIAHQLGSMTDEEFMRKYSYIVLDECHDRVVNLDIAMYRLKRFIKANCKNTLCPFLILTSATFDTMKFARYFECGAASVIEVAGQSKPIASRFPMSPCSNLVTGAVKKIVELHEEGQHDYMSDIRDIIVFVSTLSIMKDIIAKLDKYNNSIANQTTKPTPSPASGTPSQPPRYVIPISLTSASYRGQHQTYKNIYRPYDDIKMQIGDKSVTPSRRVIVSTPVAETGVTIESLKYCIDTGLVMSPEWNPVVGCTIVADRPVTQNMAIQRKGRVGRGAPGEWHPLYSKSVFDSFTENTMPDIIIKPSDEVVLSTLVDQSIPEWDGSVLTEEKRQVFQPNKLDLMDPIPLDSLKHSMQKLYTLGMIDHTNRATVRTMCATKFSHLTVDAIALVLNGYAHGANIPALATIAAFASAGDKLLSRKYKRRQIFSDRTMYKTRLFIGCDFIDYIFLYEEMREIIKKSTKPYGDIMRWCNDNHINHMVLKDVVSARDGVFSSLIRIGLNPYRNVPCVSGKPNQQGREMKYSLTQHILDDFDSGRTEICKIKRCIHEAWSMNTLTYNPVLHTYVNKLTGTDMRVESDLISNVGYDEGSLQTKPIHITYKNCVLRKGRDGTYRFSAEGISILDSYIEVDHDLLYS